MPQTLPVFTRVVLVLTTVLGLAASFLASRVVDSGWRGAVSLLWFLAPSAALLAVARRQKGKANARPVIVASTWIVAAPLALWMANVLMAAATISGEAGLGVAVALGYAGFLVPLLQLAGMAAVALVARAAPRRGESAGFLGGAALVLLSVASTLLFSIGTLSWLQERLVEVFVFGPSRRQAAADFARRQPNRDVRWEQVQAAMREWLGSEGSTFADSSGRQFRKRAGWQHFKTTSSSGYDANGDYAENHNIEGDMVPADAPDARQTYSGPATFRFHRNQDGHWIMTQVKLDGLSLTSDVSIDLSQLAGAQSRPPAAPVNPAAALTSEGARAAIEEWLAGKYSLGEDLMKDPGGAVGFVGYRNNVWSVGFAKVPYHRLGDPRRQEYSGPGEAQFGLTGDGQWALYGVWLLELELFDSVPSQWVENPDRGIPVR